MKNHDASYWDNRYVIKDTGWDIGFSSPTLIKYCLTTVPFETKILIPGCGSGYEGEELIDLGFKNVHLLDFSKSAISKAKENNPSIPDANFITDDFFKHEGQYELILEQTFFCSLHPELRPAYVKQMHKLLQPGGKIVGLLFNREFESNPPYGGNIEMYRELFQDLFIIEQLELASTSIPERTGTELFFIFERKD